MIKIVLVGESYGRHEAKYKHPLVWWSGRELARMLNTAKVAPLPAARYPTEIDMIAHWKNLRQNYGIAVTNVFNEHPEGDKTELFFGPIGEIDLPSIRINQRVLRLLPQHRHHIDRLYKEIHDLRPNLCVAMGNYACWALLGTTGISAIRGTVSMAKIPYKGD